MHDGQRHRAELRPDEEPEDEDPKYARHDHREYFIGRNRPTL